MRFISIVILVILVFTIPVFSAKFIGSFVVKDTEEERFSFTEFLKKIPIIGNFAVEAEFSIEQPPKCFFIPDQETTKNKVLSNNIVQ